MELFITETEKHPHMLFTRDSQDFKRRDEFADRNSDAS